MGGTPDGGHGELELWEGRDEIRAFIDDPTMHMRIEGRCMHLPALNFRVAIDGDLATAHTDSIVLLRDGAMTSIYGAGFTRWSMRRDEGTWRIARRMRVAIGETDSASWREAIR